MSLMDPPHTVNARDVTASGSAMLVSNCNKSSYTDETQVITRRVSRKVKLLEKNRGDERPSFPPLYCGHHRTIRSGTLCLVGNSQPKCLASTSTCKAEIAPHLSRFWELTTVSPHRYYLMVRCLKTDTMTKCKLQMTLCIDSVLDRSTRLRTWPVEEPGFTTKVIHETDKPLESQAQQSRHQQQLY
jgi:hypothetical protein